MRLPYLGGTLLTVTLAVLDPFTLSIIASLISALGAAAIVAVARKHPQVMQWVKEQVRGKNFLVLGRAIAGKTSFVNYMKYGQLPTTRPTQRTVEIDDGHSFTFDKKGDLYMPIKRAIDVPGDLGIVHQLGTLTKSKPEILLVFI